jgi:predicted permease
VDLGLKPDRLIAFWLSPDLNGYTSEQARSLYERLEDNVAATPGVSSMAASMVPLLADDNYGTNVSVEGFSAGPDTDTVAMFNEVGPGYFRTLGIPILLGREFTRDDALSRPKVAVVNEAFANKFNLGRDAVGKHMRRGSGGALDVEIVGLVQNSKYSDVKRPVPPIFCMPYRQDAAVGSMTFYVRTAGPEEQLLGTIPAIVRQLDRNLPVNHLGTMRAQVRENVFVDRLIGTLSTSFAILATLLAAVGLYGVLSYTITQRTREIGLRIAVGADPARVRRLVLGQVARMALVGGVIGLGGAALLGHAARSMLYELGAQDPIVFIASAAALTLVAFGAGLIPAQRASRIDPIKALRYE